MSESLWSAKKVILPPPKSLTERLREIAGPREDKVGRVIGEAADEIDHLSQKLRESEEKIRRLEDKVAYFRSRS